MFGLPQEIALTIFCERLTGQNNARFPGAPHRGAIALMVYFSPPCDLLSRDKRTWPPTTNLASVWCRGWRGSLPGGGLGVRVIACDVFRFLCVR